MAIVDPIMWKEEVDEEEGMMGMLSIPHCWIVVLAVLTLLMLFDSFVMYHTCLYLTVGQLLAPVAVTKQAGVTWFFKCLTSL